MKIEEKHANGASLSIHYDTEEYPYGDVKREKRFQEILTFVKDWRESQPSPQDEDEDPDKGKSGSTAYFSGAVDRKYDTDATWNYSPVIRATDTHQISLRYNEGGLR